MLTSSKISPFTFLSVLYLWAPLCPFLFLRPHLLSPVEFSFIVETPSPDTLKVLVSLGLKFLLDLPFLGGQPAFHHVEQSQPTPEAPKLLEWPLCHRTTFSPLAHEHAHTSDYSGHLVLPHDRTEGVYRPSLPERSQILSFGLVISAFKVLPPRDGRTPDTGTQPCGQPYASQHYPDR